MFHYRRAAFSTQLKIKDGLALVTVAYLRITFNLLFQEFSQRNPTWELRAFTFAARLY
jgi:hypothetical protein